MRWGNLGYRKDRGMKGEEENVGENELKVCDSEKDLKAHN
jgi:hypothetical protein